MDIGALRNEFREIRKDHWNAEQRFFARTVLGSSVIRVYQEDTKDFIMEALCKVDIEKLKKITSEAQYKEYFEKALNALAAVIKRTNKGNSRIYPGYKWGHATKILCLFLRDIVLHSRYLPDQQARRLSNWLYMPIDSVVMTRLKELGCRQPFNQINQIDTSAKFYDAQHLLKKAAKLEKVSPVWFDDNWANRKR